MGRADFVRLLDRATSQENLEADWSSILQLCDLIRQQDVRAKDAVILIRKKICDRNPHVAIFGLTVVEAVVKNCGNPVHVEIATREFMELLRDLCRTAPDQVKQKSLELIQGWSHAFRNDSRYKIIQDTYNLMRVEGHDFPPIKESDAMFSAENAPEWADGSECYLCRLKFSTFNRQHHCRACGQVFCGKCSSRNSTIPKFGIEKEVRVCDVCFRELNPKGSESSSPPLSSSSKSPSNDNDLPSEYLNSSLAKESQVPVKKSAKELQEEEEEELQLAMALSMSLNEPKASYQPDPAPARHSPPSSSASHSSYSSQPPRSPRGPSSIYSSVAEALVTDSAESDSEMARYMNRSYWEERRNKAERTTNASAPTAISSDTVPASVSPITNGEMQENGENGSEALINAFQSSIEMFMERMKSVTSKGKHIALDSTVQTLFQSLTAMHPKIVKLMEDQEEEKAKYQALLDKLQVLVDARNSLQSLRVQHQEKVRQQELEQDMLRRMQMEQKLELLRQQKQEYLLYQQQLQLQRQQEMEQKTLLMQQSMAAQGVSLAGAAVAGYVQQGQGPVPMYQPTVGLQQYGSYQPEYETPPPSLTQPPAVEPPPTYGSSTGYPAGPQPPTQVGQYQQLPPATTQQYHPPQATTQPYQPPQTTTQPFQPQENVPPGYGQVPQGQQYSKPPSPPQQQQQQQQYVPPPAAQTGSPSQQFSQGQAPASTSAPSYQSAQQYPVPGTYQQPAQYAQDQSAYQQPPPPTTPQYQPPPVSSTSSYQPVPPDTTAPPYQPPPPAAPSQQYQPPPSGPISQPYQNQAVSTPPQYQPHTQPANNPPQQYQSIPPQQQYAPQSGSVPQQYQPQASYDQYQAQPPPQQRDVELISFD